MTEVHDKISLRRVQVMFARLMELSEVQADDLAANPGKYLNDAAKRIGRAERLIDDVAAVLSGAEELLMPLPDDRYESPGAVAYRRNRKALNRIQSYRARKKDTDHG